MIRWMLPVLLLASAFVVQANVGASPVEPLGAVVNLYLLADVSADAGANTQWPTWDEVLRVVTLRDYNTRVVFWGTCMLGVAAGVVGTFMLLRKRALIADVVGHASLPGIGVAFLVMEMVSPGAEKSLSALLLGASVAGVLGILCVIAIRRLSKVKEDAALAITLSVFFGLGITLFTLIRDVGSGSQTGLNGFIEGKAATMTQSDVQVIAMGAVAVFVVAMLLFKEFTLLCFDSRFAATQGWPVLRLDIGLMLMVVGISVIGLQSVGLLLVVAMLIVPPSAARFWTDRLRLMAGIAGVIGGLAAGVGVMLSALFSKLPAGPVVVLAGTVCFAFSMCLGTRRGLLIKALRHVRLQHRIRMHHLLRALFEAQEQGGGEADASFIPWDTLLRRRSWQAGELKRCVRIAWAAGYIYREGDRYRLSATGLEEASRVVRNHRLWELYLIHYADIAPSHVDRDADQIEHILGPEVIRELETMLADVHDQQRVPPSPHAIVASPE